MLDKVSFKGERKQGTKEVNLEQQFSSTMPIYLSLNATSPGIKFDIPQGTYSQIEIKLETSTDPSGTALQVNGTYLDSSNNDVAVQFTFSAADVTDIIAKNSSGGNQIVLIADQPATVTIIINPVYWFAPVSESILDEAAEDIENGVPVIQINKDKNQDIYNLIINRINDGCEAVFN
ncbi:MAG: hypothetical protein HY840_03755 [Bacteroidetes bacterium]|nr:hypothetical protein [Bacteroidota bacterium]